MGEDRAIAWRREGEGHELSGGERACQMVCIMSTKCSETVSFRR